jgi:Na+/H+-dicarboxylate symporter
LKILIGMVAGMTTGAALELLGLQALRESTRGIAIAGTVWMNALTMTVVPLVIAGIVSAIGSISDARALLRISAVTVLVFAVLLTLASLVTVFAAGPILSMVEIAGWPGPNAIQRTTGLGAATATQIPFGQWLTQLIPANPIRAAVDGSLVQLFVFAAALGAAVTVVSAESRAILLRFFGNVTDTMSQMVRLVMALAPVALFILVLPLGERLAITAAGAAAVFGFVVTVGSAIVLVLLYLMAFVFGGVGLRDFGKACAEAQLLAAGTRSTIATVPALLRGAESQLNIPPSVSRSVVPISAGLFQVGTVIIQTAALLVLAHFYKVELNPLALATIVLASSYVSLNIPAIPGGAVVALAPALVAFSIPPEAMGIVLVVEVVAATLATVASVTACMTCACVVARHVSVAHGSLPDPLPAPAT